MKYAIYVPNFGPFGDARLLAKLARDAEEAGWDGFFIWDHITGRDGAQETVDPWIALAAIAMQTRSIQIGALVTPIPRRRPWKLARETVSLDHLSGGRLIFSVGIGSGRVDEWDNFGEETDMKVRGAMLDEGLDVLTKLWGGESFDYDGEYYHVQNTCFQPVPVQQPRIPVWVAAYWPHLKPMRRAARWDGLFPLFDPGGVSSLELFTEAVDFIRAERAKIGADGPYELIVRGIRGKGESREQWAEQTAKFAAAGATWWLEHLMPHMFGGDWNHWPIEAMVEHVRLVPPGI